MDYFLYAVLFVACFAILIKGADYLVDAASYIARAAGIPTLIIGLTIVSFGTSCPEAGVSIVSALEKANQLSYSNVVGSNTFNILMIIGVSAVMASMAVEKDVLKFDFPICLAATLLLVVFGIDCYVSRIEGIILLALIISYVVYLIIRSRKKPVATEGETEDKPAEKASAGKIIIRILIVIASIAAISLSAKGVVASCTFYATKLGVSDTIIGLTVVAFGTSLPELVTSIVAHRKGENDIAIGNVIGSNLFNILFVLGMSSTISPLTIETYNVKDGIFCLLAAVLVFLFGLTGKKVNRLEGGIMILIYTAYLVFICLRETGMVLF
ncbi:MAG: calcium/sodium antiporter [Clostridiales bacterium]|nr:calcium/sodium antiporter [Clostridiales bacterium]